MSRGWHRILEVSLEVHACSRTGEELAPLVKSAATRFPFWIAAHSSGRTGSILPSQVLLGIV